MDIQQGEFLTLLGSSGCGKTTTLRLINGFEAPDAGAIYIEGRDVSRMPPYSRNVNTVFQNYALFPHLNIFDNVAYGLEIKGLPRAEIRKRVLEMLEKVELADKAKSLPQQLSGGQMQRVALVRAIINEPKVLLLDEPLGALDAKLRKSMQLELKAVHKRLGITFIYVTHDQEEALVMSDRIAVMDRGKIAHLGTPREIYTKPKTRFVADFVGKSNFVHGMVGEELENGLRSLAIDGGGIIPSIIPKHLKPGDKVTIGIRSHSARILPGTATPASNTAFRGRLMNVVYAGGTSQMLVELSGSYTSILIEQSEGPGAPELRVGDEIVVDVNSNEVMHFMEP